MSKNLTYAKRYGKLFPVSKAKVQTSCGCVCPACNEPVVLVKDENNIYSFKHKSGINCKHGYEVSLHLAAKEILTKAGKMIVPPVFLYYPTSHKEREELYPAKEIILKDVRSKNRFGKDFPDIFVSHNGGMFYIRIATEDADEKEMQSILNDGVSTLEVTLPKSKNPISEEKFQKILLEDNIRKIWLRNMHAFMYSTFILNACVERTVVSEENFPNHIVYDCPISIKMMYGRTYADYEEECQKCEFNFHNDFQKGTLLCAGEQKIGSVKDFEIPEEVRLQQNNNDIPFLVKAEIADGICPRCGYPLVKKYGVHGEFYGCTAYPGCKFTVTIDQRTGQIKYNPKLLKD